jgi:RimK-like ATP-grasp domain
LRAKVLVASSSQETGALLKEYLVNRGVTLSEGAQKIISYGVPYPGALNGECAKGKIYNMQAMALAHVRTIPYYLAGERIPLEAYPLLARKEHGYGGTDIVPVFQPEELEWRIAAGWEWFSSYVSIQQEYRVWVWRDEVLDTYKKNMVRPQDYKFIGRNFRNGFDFVPTPGLVILSNAAIRATKAIDLTFAAVDLMIGKDGRVYVFEVNSAPGVVRSGAQATLGKLADRMVEWVRE